MATNSALKNPPPVIIAGIPVAPPRKPAADRRDLTLVLGALPQETELVEAALKGRRRGRLGRFPYAEGRIAGRRTVVAATGIGKTCASMITMLFASHFRPRELLMTGTASRINPEIRNGDVIVGEVTCNHDFGSLGANYSMEYFGAEGPLRDSMPILYPGDRRLLAAAVRAIAAHVPEMAVQHSPRYLPRVRLGRITSGDQFGIPDERIADIRRQLAPDLMEMESGSVAQVCWYLAIPFLCIRSGSNLTQGSPDDAYRKLSPFASRQAALFTVSLVAALAGPGR
ncbi:MAG TPA: 5'-methylthioadenosine/S-adenosylhomocysteine nucleosidase [Opitutaceae bacterium]